MYDVVVCWVGRLFVWNSDMNSDIQEWQVCFGGMMILLVGDGADVILDLLSMIS